LAIAYGIRVPIFEQIWVLVNGLVDLNSFSFRGLAVAGGGFIFFCWNLYFLVRRRSQKSGVPEIGNPKKEKERLDALFEDLSEPEDKEDLTDEDVDRIIRNNRIFRLRLAKVVKLGLSVFGVYILIWILTNFGTFLLWGALFVLYFFVFIRINTLFPLLMVGLYALIAISLIVFYALPYRIYRKTLRISVNGKIKDLGRIVLVKGANQWGEHPPGLLYRIWYGWRFVRHLFSRSGKSWVRDRPSPHEFPLGDVYYLKGRKVRIKVQANGGTETEIEKTERFRYSILFQSNTEGWFHRRFHPSVLYTNGKLDVGLMLFRIVEDGFKLWTIPRSDFNSVAHYELSASPNKFVERTLKSYRELVNATLDNSAGLVVRGVKADSDLQKEAQREFNLPSPSTLAEKYGIKLDKEGNPVEE